MIRKNDFTLGIIRKTSKSAAILAVLFGVANADTPPAQAPHIPTTLALSQGACFKSYAVMGAPDMKLDGFQVGIGCDIALVEDYPNGTSLSQFGSRTSPMPEIGFVTQRDASKSDSTHFYGKISSFIFRQKKIPAKAGWCMATLEIPKSAPTNDQTDKKNPKIDLKNAQWKASCVGWGLTEENGQPKKFATNINFTGAVPRALDPRMPQNADHK